MILLQAWLVAAAIAAPANVEVVKFTATWCSPCQAMEPVLEQVSQRGYSVRRIDVDQRRDLADQYQIKSVPTLLIVAGGQVVDRIDGAIPLEPLLARLDRFAAPPVAADHAQDLAVPSDRGPLPAHPTAHDDQRRDPVASVEQLAMQATVRLRVEDADGHSFGTGTIIDVHGQDALVLTCGHIFRDSQGKGKIVVDLFAPGASGPVAGELIHYDLKRDLALVGLRTTAQIVAVSVAGPELQLEASERLFSIGCNHGDEPTVLPGRLKAVNKYLGPENLTVEGRPTEGRSGGGLFSYRGQLVGVCNAADPEIDEGLYAAFPSIHRHLDDCQLSFVYREAAETGVQLAGGSLPLTPAANQVGDAPKAADDQWASVADRSDNPFPAQLALGTTAGQSDEAEVICIIRTRDEPASKSQVVVLERPSREFLSRLNEERRAQVGRQVTQMRVSPPASGGEAAAVSATRRLHRPVDK